MSRARQMARSKFPFLVIGLIWLRDYQFLLSQLNILLDNTKLTTHIENL